MLGCGCGVDRAVNRRGERVVAADVDGVRVWMWRG